MRRFKLLLATSILGLAVTASPSFAKKGDAKAKAPATAKKTPAPKKAPPKKIVPVSAEHKKALAELYAGFKFGMSKDEVIALLGKQLDERYAEKLKATTDMAAQDRMRKDKKKELSLVSSSYTSFEGKKGGWDVSIIEDEFAHNTGESMLERWENKDGKNQRRFFFFKDGKLWKMFVSLDVSILPEDKKNFDTFQGVMQGKYGPGNVEATQITWHTDEFEVRAIDKLKTYDALGLVILDPRVMKELIPLREEKAPKKAETNSVIKAVIDVDQKDHPDVKQNGGAVDDVIRAQGGTPPKK
jgi:hypothetical protein